MDELAYGLRVNIHYGLVQSIDDGGQAQTAVVQAHDRMACADIEVMQPYGFASVPPIDGAIAAMLSVGGDPAQFVLLPLCNPSVRFGGLLSGESVQYAYDGSRVHIRQGGTVQILAGNTVVAQVGTQTTLTMTDGTIVAKVGSTTLTVAAAGVTIDGILNCGNIVSNGSITATGSITGNV